MYFTDRGIEELEQRRGEEQVSLQWVAEQLRTFVDLHPEFENATDRLATFLAVRKPHLHRGYGNDPVSPSSTAASKSVRWSGRCIRESAAAVKLARASSSSRARRR